MRFPPSATPDEQQAWRDVWAAIDALRVKAELNLDLHGKRVINAGDAVQQSDYVTKRQFDAATTTTAADGATGGVTVAGEFRDLLVHGLARFLGAVIVGDALDACVLFTEHGTLSGDQDNLSWRYTSNTLRFGPATRLKWHHGAELKNNEPGGGLVILELTGEDEGATSVCLLAFGAVGAGAPGLKPNGATLEVRLANDSAYANLAILGLLTNDVQLLHARSTLTNAAGVALGTLTNAPSAGDPTKWIEIDDNGTTRRIPAW